MNTWSNCELPGAVTVTAAVPLRPSLVAVIVTGPPAATPVTSPLASTLATAGVPLAHVRVAWAGAPRGGGGEGKEVWGWFLLQGDDLRGGDRVPDGLSGAGGAVGRDLAGVPRRGNRPRRAGDQRAALYAGEPMGQPV